MKIPTVLVAPMAGGPSSPELVSAAARAGSLGFLAPGGGPASTLVGWMSQVKGDYGVNLFAKQKPFDSLIDVRRVAAELAPGEPLPEVDYSNEFDAKFAAILGAEHPPVVVSSTFGPFTAEEIDALHERDIAAWITVTTPEDAVTAAEVGADVLVVQGPDAGGHRSTWTVEEEPDDRPLEELLRAVAERTDLPIVTAGGVRGKGDVDKLVQLPHVVAVSCGSVFLLADEAGTSPANRELLAAGGQSVASRAFSGRVARGLATDFSRTHEDMPAIYPYLSPLVSGLRKADPVGNAYCLVGTDVAKLSGGSVAEILRRLGPHQGVVY